MTANSAHQGPATAAGSLFTHYDIESLDNVFSVVAYTYHENLNHAEVDVFYLVDDEDLRAGIDFAALSQKITSSNPGLPPSTFRFHDLSSADANFELARIMGLSDAETVGHRSNASSYPAELRPVCDTDPEWDPKIHPFVVGYNSFNYDSVMISLYLAHAFGQYLTFSAQREAHVQRLSYPEHAEHARRAIAEMDAAGPRITPPTAAQMRQHNDKLFSEEHIKYMPSYLAWGTPAAKIRKAMMDSGRHVDAARLNELQTMAALKRLLGMIGRQILESDNLSHDTVIASVEQLLELLAYNVSDCLGLSQLMDHSLYSGNFDLKAGLLHQYSECRYGRSGTSIRRDRLAVDSSSAKFVGRILAPYESLSDIDGVSYLYPHPEQAREQGIEPMNVLDHCFAFFRDEVLGDFFDPVTKQMVPAPSEDDPSHAAWLTASNAWMEFLQVVLFYKSIEGENFNEDLGRVDTQLKHWPKLPNNLPYFRRGGVPTSCFATFSTGGIHGAEHFEQKLEADRLEAMLSQYALLVARQEFPDARDFVAEAKRQHDTLVLPDGSTVAKSVVLLGSDPAKVKFRKPKKDDPAQSEQVLRAQSFFEDPADLLALQRPSDQALNVRLSDGRLIEGKQVLKNTSAAKASYREEPAKAAPVLFKKNLKDDATKLNPRYTFTSAGHVVHEDFTSYYPNLLRNMRAFYNPELGEDRYAKIFFEKEEYGAMLKDPDLGPAEYARIKTLREGTKLILNSASGAGDAGHQTPIKMNNQIISMRIMGQLFSWLIGQAQTIWGAKIVSTNTDGLYSLLDPAAGFTQEVNDRVLAEQEQNIHVEIEPEPMFLISKDSNNRLELMRPKRKKVAHLTDEQYERMPVEEWAITTAGGGTLACWEGPSPRKALAHPAVIDYALARYLQTVAARGQEALSEPFDPALGRMVLAEAVDHDKPVETLMMFQNVIAASRGSITYPFALEPLAPSEEEESAASEQAPGTAPLPRDTGDVEELGDEDLDQELDLDGEISNSVVEREYRSLQMINRVFVVKPGSVDGACNLMAAGAWKVPPASRARRVADGLRIREVEPMAKSVLRAHGLTVSSLEAQDQRLTILPDDEDITVRKISGIDPNWHMVIQNHDLHQLDAETTSSLIDALDLEVYLSMLESTFEKNWRNAL